MATQPTITAPGANAPAVVLPLVFILTGLLALLTGIAWLVARPDLLAGYHYNQYIVAVTHLFVLGWIASVVMGAMYQLVPVALETKLHSETLARWHYAFHLIGFTGMVWMFRSWNPKQVGHFGMVLVCGIGLFVYNLARTLRRVPKWNVTATAVASALAWLVLTVTVGLGLAAAKCSLEGDPGTAAPGAVGWLVGGLRHVAAFVLRFDAISAMHAHAHLGVIGCFTMLIVGVSYKLIPMFTLSEVQNSRRATASIVLLNLGLAGAFVCIVARSPWKLAWAADITLALGLYGWEVRAMLGARKRVKLDWGLTSFLTAIALLGPLALLGMVLAWPGLPQNPVTGQLENAYGFLGLGGVISFAIIGMLYKILPFLVWFARYSPQIGRGAVPALADLYSARWQQAGYWSYLAGLGLTTIAIVGSSEILVRCGCMLLAASLFTLVGNVAKMLAHFFRPNVQAFHSQTNLTTRPA